MKSFAFMASDAIENTPCTDLAFSVKYGKILAKCQIMM
jgi:hypothetical protein